MVGCESAALTAPVNADNYSGINSDKFHKANGSAKGCGKGTVVALHTAATELRQFKQVLGDSFHDFARTRLGLAPEMADFLVRVAELGLDPAQFSPAIEVKLSAVLETMARIVATWATIISGTMPTANGTANVTSTTTPTMAEIIGTAQNCPDNNVAAISDVLAADCEGSADVPTTSDTQADTDNVTALTSETATITTPTEVDEAASDTTTVTSATATVASNDAAESGDTPVTIDDASGDVGGAVVEPIPQKPQITLEQRRFLAQRKVSLLLKVERGEMSIQTAMRQAEKMPLRRVR